jgi:hypothetical protein
LKLTGLSHIVKQSTRRSQHQQATDRVRERPRHEQEQLAKSLLDEVEALGRGSIGRQG